MRAARVGRALALAAASFAVGLAALLPLAAGRPAEPFAQRPVPPPLAPAADRDSAVRPVAPAAGLPGPVAEPYLGVLLPGRAVELVAGVAGRVREVAVRPGDAVAAGQILVTLAPASAGHQVAIERAALAAAESESRRLELEATEAERDLARLRALAELVSRRDLEAAEFRLAAARARRESALAERARVGARVDQLVEELGRSEVRAPFAGTVALRHVDPGAEVAAGSPLARLVAADEPFVRFALPPERAADLPPGSPVRVELGAPARSLRAVVRRVGPEVDAASQMAFAEARLVDPPAAGLGHFLGSTLRVVPEGLPSSVILHPFNDRGEPP